MGFNKDEYFKGYRKSNYTQLSAAIPKEIADQIREKLKRDGLSFRQFIINSINEYLKKGL